MELIKEAFKRTDEINNVLLQLYDIIKNLKLTNYERDDLAEYMANLDMALAKIEMKLEEIDMERGGLKWIKKSLKEKLRMGLKKGL